VSVSSSRATAGKDRRQAAVHGVWPMGGSASRQLVPVAIATVLVAVLPVSVVWWLRASGNVTSSVFGMAIGIGLSLCASYLGRTYWEKRPGSEDRLFSELMIWGYLHRWRTERRLASARELLGPMNRAQRSLDGGLSAERQTKLLQQLATGMDARDPNTQGHSRRVARHSWMIARRMGLSREEVARIRTAAAVHDIGKIETPTAILRKEGSLTDSEYAVIKRHPGDGARMAEVLRDVELTSIVRHHHERIDGSGYPDGLVGESIPLGARILAVADTFDAITSARPYRPACPHKKALDILRADAGTRLDPHVVRAFCGHYSGRRPLTLWAFLASLPERVISWLEGSVSGVAAAAKVMAVAAVVGSAAAGSATLAKPVSNQVPRARTVAYSQAESAGAQPNAVSAPSGVQTSSARSQGSGERIAVLTRLGSARSGPTVGPPATAAAATSTAGGPQSSPSSAPGQGAAAASGQTSGEKHTAESPTVKGEGSSTGEGASKVKSPSKPEGPGKPTPPVGSAKPEKPAPPAKPEKPAPPAKPEKPAPPAKPEKPSPPAKPEKPEPAPKPEAPSKAEKPPKAEKPGASGNADTPGGAEKPEGKNKG
jgi:hypothetical protein